MATLGDLVNGGVLRKFKPLMDIGQMEMRSVYLTEQAYDWCYSSKELGRAAPNPLSYDTLHAAFTDFAVGSLFYLDAQIRRLERKKETSDTWEIKTKPPDAVRAFGWFYNKNIFVVTHCEMKKNIGSYEPHKQTVVDFRAAHNCLYAPSFGRRGDEKEYFNI